MLAALRAYCTRNPTRCLRMLGVPSAAEITESVVRDSEVPAALEEAQDALGEGPISLACMRGAPLDHVIHEFLVPLMAAESDDEDWADPDWCAFFARGIADRLVQPVACADLRAAEALVDALGFVGDLECARAVVPDWDARETLRRARRYTGHDAELLCAVDASHVLARIQMIPMVGELGFPEFATLEWTVVVDSILLPVLCTGMDERAATRALVVRMLSSDAPMAIRRAWLEALDDADVGAVCDQLVHVLSVVPRRLMPALVAARHADDAPVGPHVRAVLLDVATGAVAVAPETLEALLAKLPSAMFDVAVEASAHETATRAALGVRAVRADLVPIALRSCSACRNACGAACALYGRARSLARACAPEALSDVIRGGLVAELALAMDDASFARLCGALGHARLATLLASLDRACGPVDVGRARAEIERRLFGMLEWR